MPWLWNFNIQLHLPIFNRLFNLNPEEWIWGYHLRFFRAWIWKNMVYFLGRHLISFWFTVWNPAFSQVATLKKIQIEFYPIFLRVAKAPIFLKLNIGCRLKGLVFSMFASCFCGTIQSAGSSRPIVSTFRHFKVILSPIKPLKFYILPILNALMSGPINYLTLNLPPRTVLDISIAKIA